MAHHRANSGSTLKPQLLLPLAESNALLLAETHFIDDDRVFELAESTDGNSRRVAAPAAEHLPAVEQALSGSEFTPPRPPVTPDATGELHELAAGFCKWTGARTEDFPKMSVEKQLYSAFRDLVLFVMHCLKGIVLEPPEDCCLLLPYSEGSDFKPVDSNESDKLDQVLVVRAWDSSVAGVAQAKYADTFAAVEATRVEKVSFDGSSRAIRDGGAVLQKARQQVVRYNRQVYEHQHNRMFTWGLTVCDSLVRACLFDPDRVLSSGYIDVATPDGRRVFVGLLVSLCLCEERHRGYIPTIQQHDDADGRYWTIRCNRINSSGEQEAKMATFYSRGPAMAADRNFGRRTRGFPVAERLEYIDSPTLFAKVAWHYVEREVVGEQRCNLLHRDMSTSSILVVCSPLVGVVHGVLVDFDCANFSLRRPHGTLRAHWDAAVHECSASGGELA
ncbi:hypothetical protein GQ54DRAFT_306959 [Martensiomyces pterosporus]|nr:hypothetical protein GQ54DRAFT_306959 [Martensiomyces pterosporus]